MKKLLAISLFALGCNDTRPAIEGTQSLAITLVSPADPGDFENRLPDSPTGTPQTFTIDVEARDAENQLDTSFDTDVQVYAQFLGTLTPTFGGQPLATFHVTAGVATNQVITLPLEVRLFGPTVLWIDDGSGLGPEYVHGKVTGTSPTLFFRDPFIADLQTPRDETALDALAVTPLQDKQIAVDASRHGPNGRLVVNSVFSQGYTVTDVLCADADGNPPCDTPARLVNRMGTPTLTVGYDHAMVFTFSAPRDQCFRSLEVGQVIGAFAGGLAEFNGLSEIGFPQTFIPNDGKPILEGENECDHVIRDVNPARLPAPAVLDPATWFNSLSDPQGMINFERNEAAPIQINNGKVCDLDDDFETFKQWKLDPNGNGGDCSNNDDVVNIITTGITTIDPTSLVGQTLPRVVGVVRPVSIGSFNVWIIFPRSADDVTLQ
jgi:hypothetical protein